VISFSGLEWGVVGLALGTVALLAFLTFRRKTSTVLRFSFLADVKEASHGQRLWGRKVVKGLRCATIVLLVVALFRPRAGQTVEEVLTPGIDIAIALDLSGSMRAEDMGGRSRVEAAKDVIVQFISGRTHDRIGLVIFAAKAFTQCPLTIDYGLLERLVTQLDVGSIKEDSTAMGVGLACALNRLKNSSAKSKLVILVTDGRSNAGSLDPETAAEMAKSLGIKVYTVGVASKGPARIPVKDPFGRTVYATINEDLNEESLTQIARSTGGLFRRATDDQALSEIFTEISNLEKTPVKVREYQLYQELFLYLVVPALILFITEFLLAHTVFRRIP